MLDEPHWADGSRRARDRCRLRPAEISASRPRGGCHQHQPLVLAVGEHHPHPTTPTPGHPRPAGLPVGMRRHLTHDRPPLSLSPAQRLAQQKTLPHPGCPAPEAYRSWNMIVRLGRRTVDRAALTERGPGPDRHLSCSRPPPRPAERSLRARGRAGQGPSSRTRSVSASSCASISKPQDR